MESEKYFIYIQDRLREINNYLTYRPRVKTPLGIGTIIIDQNCYRIEYDNGKLENLVKSLRFWQDDFKLIVRELSDLTKEITHNGETFVPIEKLSEKCRMQHELFELQNTIDLKALDYLKLLQWHFDIHGLIERNLAVNLNDLPNE